MSNERESSDRKWGHLAIARSREGLEGVMSSDNLSFNTRKSLCNHLGELAGVELAEFLQHLKSRLERVESNKVDITRIVPDTTAPSNNA